MSLTLYIGFCMTLEELAEPFCPPSLCGHMQLMRLAGTHTEICLCSIKGFLPLGPQVRKMLSLKHTVLVQK